MKNLGIAFLLFLPACQSPDNGNQDRQKDSVKPVAAAPLPKDTTTLAGTWYLEPVLPSDTATGRTAWITLNLDISGFRGSSGCNSMHGKFFFSTTDSSLSFGDKIVIGKRGCAGYNEAAFLKSLKSTGRYRLRGGVLTLMADNRTELSRWTRTKATVPKTTVT
jgi:heat shock protein HslJ